MRVAVQIAILAVLAAGLAVGWPLLSGGDGDAGASKSGKGGGEGTLVLTEPVALADDNVVVRAVGLSRERLVDGLVGEVEILGHRLVGDDALVHVEAGLQVRIALHGPLVALVGKR